MNDHALDSPIVKIEPDHCGVMIVTGRRVIASAFSPVPPQPGGCVGYRPFRVVLTYLEKGAADTLRLGGTVMDAYPAPETRVPIVMIRVVRRGVEVSRALTDYAHGGRFDLVAQAGDSAIMTFSAFGYSTMEADLGRLARVAGRTRWTLVQ
ncbi:MAG TPA: hypothetical protein VF263_24245 [Longimicrobiaceae bacterium]